jgi:aspartate 1-decarboxylase
MLLNYLKSKIHRATITEANLHYEGSISIGPDLLDTAGIQPFEKVSIYNVNNGERFETYAILGKKGEICLNGAAAWKGKVGDIIIIACYCFITPEEASQFLPKLVYVDDKNEVKNVGNNIPVRN